MPDSTRLTDEELNALLELEERATPGPWLCASTVSDAGGWWGTVPDNAPETVVLAGEPQGSTETPYAVCCTNDDGIATENEVHDAALIAASRNSIRDIILDLQASREREKELVEALKELLYQVNNIEVLGEWSALDMNRSSGKKLRAEVDATVTKSREALARAEAKEKP